MVSFQNQNKMNDQDQKQLIAFCSYYNMFSLLPCVCCESYRPYIVQAPELSCVTV